MNPASDVVNAAQDGQDRGTILLFTVTSLGRICSDLILFVPIQFGHSDRELFQEQILTASTIFDFSVIFFSRTKTSEAASVNRRSPVPSEPV